MAGRGTEHERVEAVLSEYLDGGLSAQERARVEAHLAACPDCARSLSTLHATVSAVRELPHVRAPRSFALPHSMAKPARPSLGLYLALRGATAAVALLFCVVVAGDIFLRAGVTQMAAPVALQDTAQVTGVPELLSSKSAPGTGASVGAAEAGAPAPSPDVFAAQPAPTLSRETAPGILPPVAASPAQRAALSTSTPVPPAPAAAQKAAPTAAAQGTAVIPSRTPALGAAEAVTLASGTSAPVSGAGMPAATVSPATLAQPKSSAATCATVAPTPTAQPTQAAPGEPTAIAQAGGPRPPVAADQPHTYQPPSLLTPWRIAEGVLAVAALILAIATLVARSTLRRRRTR